MIDTRSMDPSETVAKKREGRTLADMKAHAPGAAYSESTSTAFSHSAEKPLKQVTSVYHAAARSLAAELGPQTGSPGPVESELKACNSGKVVGLVAGAFAELLSAFHVIIDLVASQFADAHLLPFDIDYGTCRSIFHQQVRGS